MTQRGMHRLLVVLVALGCVGVTAMLVLNVFGRRNDNGPLSGGGVGPTIFDRPLDLREYELTDTRGEPFGSKDLRGKVYIASFIFTRCGETCPLVLRQTELLRDFIGEKIGWDGLRLVSITLDAEYDTPAVLAEAAELRDAKPGQWVFLTDGKDKTRDVIRGADGFRSPVGDNPENKTMPIAHNSNYVLVDRDGRIRGYYDALKQQTRDALMRDLVRLLKGGG